jgi:hypothetical protein
MNTKRLMINISDVIKYSVKWWDEKGEIAGFKRKEHLENPEVNCASKVDINLANAVAKYLKEF